MTFVQSTPRAGIRRGFSLLEVIIVLAILGIVAGVTVPALRDVTRTDDLTASADEIVSLIDRTRRTAVDHGTRATLTIDVSSARYWVSARNASGERTIANGAIPLVAGAELVGREARSTFAFDPSGRALATDLAVRLSGTTVPIMVDPWRGDARVGAP